MKAPKIKDAEITEDGCLVITFNAASKVYPHTPKAIFTPDVLLGLVEEYAEIPPAQETDYPGIPIVTEEAVFDVEEDKDKEKPDA